MVVIYAEKSSLAKEIAHALGAGKRIALKDEPTVGYYEFVAYFILLSVKSSSHTRL